jgi:hypothetical protein
MEGLLDSVKALEVTVSFTFDDEELHSALLTPSTPQLNIVEQLLLASVPTGPSVTAPSLTSLTDGSDILSILHTHSDLGGGGGAGSGIISGTSGEAFSIGTVVAYDNLAGAARLFKASAAAQGPLAFAQGIAISTSLAPGTPVSFQAIGDRSIADAFWDAVPLVTDGGAPVYLSITPGKLTLTPPVLVGNVVKPVGVVIVGGAGVTRIAVQIGPGTTL